MISLFKPYMPSLPLMPQILASGALSYGKYTQEFENQLREYFSTPYVIVTNSFFSAISVAVASLGLKWGDEIIVSPMGCLASTQPYLTCGMKIKWCDVDSERGTLSPEALRRTITSSTKAIIHNHYCGYPGYIDEINSIGKEYGIPVIDDGIECFGSRYKEKLIGNCGTDVTVFSLGAVRIPNCIDGGIVIFKDEELYKKSILIRDCGIDRSTFRDELGEINPECDIKLVGYSATMNNVNGYIGLEQMKNVNDLLQAQRKNAEKWKFFFSEQSSYIPIYCEGCEPNYWIYGILTEKKRETIVKFREMGYYASGVHINNNIYSVFDGVNECLPGTVEFNRRFVALPCGWWMSQNIGGMENRDE